MISKHYFNETFNLATARDLQDWAENNLLDVTDGDYGMKISHLADGEMFTQAEITGLQVDIGTIVRLDVKEIVSNDFRVYITDTPGDWSRAIAELSYGLGQRILPFTPTAETMYIGIGDLNGASGIYSIVDNVRFSIGSIENGTFEDGTTTGWTSINATTEAYGYSVESPIDDPVITGTAYYFASNGDDSNDGLSKGTAKRTLKELETVANNLNAGDGILLRSGDTFYVEQGYDKDEYHYEIIVSNINGTEAEPISFSWYHEDDANPQGLPILSCLMTQELTFTQEGAITNEWVSNESVVKNPRCWKGTIDDINNIVELRPPAATDDDYDNNSFDDYIEFSYSGTNPNKKLRRRTSTTVAPDGDYTYSYSANIIQFSGCTHFVMNKWRFAGGTTWVEQVYIKSCQNYTVQNCHVGGKAHRGSFFGSGILSDWASDGLFTHNTFDTEYYIDSWDQPSAMSTDRGPHNLVMWGSYSKNMTIQYNSFLNFKHVGLEATGGIEYGTGSPITIQDFIVLHNTFSSPHVWYSRPMSLSSMGIRCEFAYNIISNCSTRSQLSWQDLHIHHNIWKDQRCSAAQSIIGGEYMNMAGQCFETTTVLGDPRNWLVENNIFSNIETDAIHILPNKEITIRNNVFMDCDTLAGGQAAIYLYKYGSSDPTEADQTQTYIYNNLFYKTGDVANAGNERIGWGNQDGGYMDSSTIANLDTSALKISTGANLEDNPDFVDTTSFKLITGSPAIGTGLQPTATKDYDGTDIVAPYNIGIYNTEE